MNWGTSNDDNFGAGLGEGFAGIGGGNAPGNGGINECEVALPRGSLGISLDGFPATVTQIDNSSPFKRHGVYAGMMVDTVTVTDPYGYKKIHYEMNPDDLASLLQKQQISRKGKCMIRFVAPHYIVTPPPVPNKLDLEGEAIEYDNVSLLSMKDGDQGSVIGDDDASDSSTRRQASKLSKNKQADVGGYKLDAPTEETTDDEEYDGDDIELRNTTFENEYNDGEVYELPSTPKKTNKKIIDPRTIPSMPSNGRAGIITKTLTATGIKVSKAKAPSVSSRSRNRRVSKPIPMKETGQGLWA
mmetsp:Transcript_32723/g.49317  ORF Transcript_32723/g.49317 Transcript_32723/m.49317 type:complete len:300 (+) Transcript_32723:125-1024(+)|eukprot:CAMPEP_0178939044 /NCGR_PEP_ID=MMETSP0786-20121207/26665_1 /TAXON_ID=186022 /ORGANISM="Thalassionema frauenfeldii, Strain CCMP 1798" /LENGTH=299 /DNA_ID=CAMNT_0020617825 /DNA_START=192 /DNA_END=1091 /DNA_ORIENTATION=-